MLSEIKQFMSRVRMRSPRAKTWRDYKCDPELFNRVEGNVEILDILPEITGTHELEHDHDLHLHRPQAVSPRRALGPSGVRCARAFDQTVMSDYFQAVEEMEEQPDGAWFKLNETRSLSNEQ